jgi:hypothetical protein
MHAAVELLNYIYRLFFLAHEKGGTAAMPLLFTDPSDVDARWVVSAELGDEVDYEVT